MPYCVLVKRGCATKSRRSSKTAMKQRSRQPVPSIVLLLRSHFFASSSLPPSPSPPSPPSRRIQFERMGPICYQLGPWNLTGHFTKRAHWHGIFFRLLLVPRLARVSRPEILSILSCSHLPRPPFWHGWFACCPPPQQETFPRRSKQCALSAVCTKSATSTQDLASPEWKWRTLAKGAPHTDKYYSMRSIVALQHCIDLKNPQGTTRFRSCPLKASLWKFHLEFGGIANKAKEHSLLDAEAAIAFTRCMQCLWPSYCLCVILHASPAWAPAQNHRNFGSAWVCMRHPRLGGMAEPRLFSASGLQL